MRVYNSLNIVPSSEPTLSQGSSGNNVLQLQEALTNAGFSPGGVDGSFGPDTRAAVLAFQKANGLSQDGVVGPNTWAALARASNAAPAAPSAPSSGEPTLSDGSTGAAVSTLQKDLAADGFSAGATDGVFGANTLRSVESFQRANGLSVDGVVGQQTWAALAHPRSASPSPAPAPASGAEPTVDAGSSGAAVLKMQQLLTNAGYSTDGEDGVFGQNTLSALLRFQGAHGLATDGVCGPETWAALEGAKPSAPPSPGPTPSSGSEPTVQNGSTGTAVTQLQNLLNQAGFNTDGVDGDFGANTQSALMSYQYSRGLSVDGVCGPQTWGALLSHAPAVKSGPPPAPAGSSANLVAQKFLGEEQHQLEYSGQLPEDTWVPLSEDCANFVSSCLQVAGLLPASQHEDGVVNLKNNLLADGWTNTFNGSPTGVPLSAAKPGDVVCFDGPGGSFQHVEIFNGFVNGQPQYIGSNNILSDGTQEVSTDTGSWAYTVHIYAPPA